jgi:hypothetical protein
MSRRQILINKVALGPYIKGRQDLRDPEWIRFLNSSPKAREWQRIIPTDR